MYIYVTIIIKEEESINLRVRRPVRSWREEREGGKRCDYNLVKMFLKNQNILKSQLAMGNLKPEKAKLKLGREPLLC